MEEEEKNAEPNLRNHRAGFVSIIGKPNVGKSALMNVLVGEKMSIITSKAQTTRHRILGILNGKHEDIPFQLVYSDTPGVIKPSYKLHDNMMTFVKGSLEDADVVLFVVEVGEKVAEHEVLPLLGRAADAPILVILNKVDLVTEEQVQMKIKEWEDQLQPAAVIPISALEQFNIDKLFEEVITRLPFHPPYFDQDELTDKPERFFASEMIREKIFLNYRQEIPYSSEVMITEFKERDDMIVIRAEILVERKSQKGIIIGEKGEMLKKVGTQARLALEEFFGKKVFLEQHVKVEPDWRSKENKLRQLGYQE